jgi:hypothetical protein
MPMSASTTGHVLERSCREGDECMLGEYVCTRGLLSRVLRDALGKNRDDHWNSLHVDAVNAGTSLLTIRDQARDGSLYSCCYRLSEAPTDMSCIFAD